ncbi:cytoplasmic dynein 2 heavy chain 1-like isoform X3 [Pomacea canaliculata]|uniref:cytoplasmic dynein 2 heavy chain 1-like isoform X3 n=1 Tax=Pomacea canaliculata TaxID=400727 RepID=UPI000D732FC1|nr:cytoplasmic dynein 2 heavy chain 1-like isoform X3 [Pomacea canaliculata]
MPGDSRKDFILVTVANYFAVPINDTAITNLFNAQPLNGFLDDGNISVLAGKIDQRGGRKIDLQNQIDQGDSKERVIVFFKIKPDVITPDNTHSNIIVSSMIDSPLSTLYHALQKVYAPLLLEDTKWSKVIDPKLQGLLNELEVGLGSTLRKQDPSFRGRVGDDDRLGGILTPMDEFQYWAELSRSGVQSELREAAENYVELFKPISKDFGGLDSLALSDVIELVEITQDTLDDVWKQSDPPFAEARMRHLLDVIAGSFGRYVQRKLSNEDLWQGQFSSVREALRMGITICDRWTIACETLTVQFWKRLTHHPWKGEKFSPETLKKLSERLEEILSLRTFHEQVLHLLTDSERRELHAVDAFNPFLGLNPVQYNPYTQPLWAAAVAQYERAMEPAQQKVAGKLRTQFQVLDGNPQQLLREFQRFKELIKRPAIRKLMVSERETLLGQLMVHVRQISEDFSIRTGHRGGKGVPKGKNLPDVVNNIVYVRQLEAKIDETLMTAETLLGDLNGFEKFGKDTRELKEELQNWRREQFDEWSREMQALIDDPKQPLSLETHGRLMELNHKDGKMKVNYSERLVTLLREVRQLGSLGFSIPSKIQTVAATAQKFYRHGVILKQVAHFYNTIDQQMIPSQQAMMLESALAFERLVKNPKSGVKSKADDVQVTWDNPEQLEAYIRKLQAAADQLTTENRKLRKSHYIVSEKVQQLMAIDLLRQQQRWKDGLMDIRHLMASLVEQGFASDNMKPWRAHWDRQLYKALEHQYQMGLEALNENLPEIRVELTYRQQKLQFKPPFEEIKAKYFREMKKFISIPSHFRGVGEGVENPIFPAMIDRNAEGFVTCYRKGAVLFKRLAAVVDQFRDWVVLGALDLEQFVAEHLVNLADWERNFRALKARGRDVEKLPSEAKVDCIIVNLMPVKAAIDDHIQRLFDALLSSLRKSISADVASIDSFITVATETLSQRPQTVEEIGQANAQHVEYATKRREVKPLFEKAEAKNKLLRSVAGGGVDSLSQLQGRWDKFELMMESHQLMVKEQVEVMKNNVQARVAAFQQDVEKFAARWHQLKPGNATLDADKETCDKAVSVIRDKRLEFAELEKTRATLISDCQHFELKEPDFVAVEELKLDIEQYEGMWSLYEEFNGGLQDMAKEDWISFRSKTYLFEEFLGGWYEKLKTRATTTMTVRLQRDIDTYKNILPVLKWVRGEPLSQDHWMELFRLLQMPRGTTLEKLTFGNILASSELIIKNAETLKELNQRAQGEVTIREAIRELELWGAGAMFSLTEYEDSHKKKLNIIKDWKDLVNQVGDNQSLLQSLKDSPYYRSFEDKASVWEQRLADLDEYLHNLNQIQRKWVYLEPIFGRGALPKEQGRFKRVDDDFRTIMKDVNRDNRVLSLATQTGLRVLLNTMLDQLGRCQKSLNEFLEEKRSLFPRFYFIGDDDLLEILGQSTNPTVIQSHLKKLFAGIHSVEFDGDNQHIMAMKSLDGEVVLLKHKVKIVQEVEVWLGKLAEEMKVTLRELLKDCLKDAKSSRGGLDPNRYPSQILCLAEGIRFSENCEEAIKKGRLRELFSEVEGQLDFYTNVDLGGATEVEAVVLELKLKALILDTIHSMDVVQQLMEANIRATTQWQWQKQLRYYLDKDGLCRMRMVDAEFDYTYEYQGNAQKLVHTPLTDKCYLTLTQGMHMGLGGNPYGPAGTGKTESVKALGGLFGRQVLVFNCDEGIDVRSMERIFIGLIKCGAWGCFDEFNRLEEAVLSAVSMQIQVIQDAIKNRVPSIEMQSKTVNIDHNSGIFITMNPAGKGYGGRQKLPDNLKQLFRPVAMSKPDNDLIAEVILFSEGFKHAKSLGRKLVAIFNLSRELLTPQQHYDWGLRALKTVLRGCGNLLQNSKKSSNGGKIDSNHEAKLVVQALRINTLSKLTFSDSTRFDGLVKDVFPGIEFKDIEYETLAEAIRSICVESNLIVNQNQVRKALELYEQLRQRMGVVVVGPSGSGKTILWRVLRQAMIKAGRQVKQYVMNPKAMPRTQLLGHIDMDTREWTDGVLTYSARQVVREPIDVQSWIVCDGDIDPEWIESLNSVLDDNRLLTMPSGERIQFGPNVNFLFETHDLSCASPATISRMGMIFLSDEDVDVKALIQSWISRLPEQQQQRLSGWIEDCFYKALTWVLKQNDTVVETSMVGMVLNGLSHLHNVQSKAHFAVSLIHGLGGNLNEASREIFAKEVFSWIGESPPDNRRPLDTYYDDTLGRLMTYTMEVRRYFVGKENAESVTVEQFSSLSSLPVVRTSDVQRSLDYFMPWLDPDNKQPFIIVGPEGCGKGLLLHHSFQNLRSTQVAMVHCSAQTGPSHVLQKLGQTCMVLNTNTGRVYRPKDSERLILYLKDINLPKPDKWGTCQLIAFLQQVVTYNGFYDSNLEWVGLEGVQIVASMNAGTSLGRHKLTSRFTSVVRICNVGYPGLEQLQSIYAAYLKPILHRQLAQHPVWGSKSKIHALAGSMVQLYEQLRVRFTVDDYSHYLFTPRDLTRWVVSLLRYDLNAGSKENTNDHLLEIWAYEARRLFRDRIVGADNQSKFDNLLMSVIRSDWSANIFENIDKTYFVTWGARTDTGAPASGAGAPLPPFGKPLGKLSPSDLQSVIERGIKLYSRENRELDILVFKEVLDNVACVDRVLTSPGGSLLLAGQSGVGRRTAVTVVAHMHQMQLFTPKISRSYGDKQFRSDLKQVMQIAGLEGQQVVLLLEDHQFVELQFLELINSLLSAGEVPGLYSPEELEPLLSPLRDMASEVGFRGTLINFFASRVRSNLHIALIMDYTNVNFILNCESNPALYKQCCVQWMDGWSQESMVHVPRMLLTRPPKVEGGSIGESQQKKRKLSGGEELLKSFLHVHESMGSTSATPLRYLTFLRTYEKVYSTKKLNLEAKQKHLQAGVSKLNDAKQLVDELKRKANEQSQLLAEKQAEADAALREITVSMQDASDQKIEMEELKKSAAEENKALEKRKKAIDQEMAAVEPLVQEARRAVGSIKPESISEIRALRAPPDIIRDILEGVLRLMGIFDTSWVSMKSFLSKRGVKEDIQTFDARNITPEIRKSVEELLLKNKDSFDSKNARRASQVAEPLAEWVTANIKYSYVIEKIEPLEKEQNELRKNLEHAESRMARLSQALGEVDRKVSMLRSRFENLTKEAAELKIKLDKENETIHAAETLVSKLDGEHHRWNMQMGEFSQELQELPRRALLASAFITYLASAPEDLRRERIKAWMEIVGVSQFDLRRFLSTESEQLMWKAEGLPSDELSMENAMVILQSSLRPFLVDPSSRATEWLKTHLKEHRLEVINQQDSNFSTALELAVRFGKTLIIQEIDRIEPVLFPLLRGDLTAQGPRYVVQIGEKVIDYNEDFKLFMATRNPNPEIPPDAASIITEVNFTTTRAGLTGQLLALTIQNEKPELEVRKTDLLKQEEDLKIQLAKLEESLLEELASAKGNILENKELLDSLNKTKASSITISDSLEESVRLQASLDAERNSYLPLAASGSCLYFVISDLAKINNMYRFSLAAFLRLFQRSLHTEHDGSGTEIRIRSLSQQLQRLVYEYVCRSLFKVDRLMFAVHMAHGTKPELFQDNEWEAFTGMLVADVKGDHHAPSWVDEERASTVAALKANLPRLYQQLSLEDTTLWSNFARSSHCEEEFPSSISKHCTLFQQVLTVQATRPDRLQSAMALFACKALGMKELSPPSISLKTLYHETLATEPVLVVISPGADPSQELQDLASEIVGLERYHQVAMGQGQAEIAMQLVRECANNGDWLCLKNLHLVTAWLPALEKEINSMKPHKDFRLWMTAEVHPKFPTILLQSSLKITYESPPGVKQNLLRTYEGWSPEYVARGGNTVRSQALFALAWFHAVVQERRVYIPQGWTKFYEFSLSDLRAGADIIDRLCASGQDVQWNFVHGLFEFAIYGGRVDNPFDMQVLVSYLKQFFDSSVLSPQNKNKRLGPLHVPVSTNRRDYQEVISSLPESDHPSYFGLPENIERSAQRIISLQVISQLRILQRGDAKASRFDKEVWANQLGPILNLWKKLNQGLQLIQTKIAIPSERAGHSSPILSFLHLERYSGIKLVQSVHASLAALSKVIRGTQLLTSEVQNLAAALLNQETPLNWLSQWDGPEDPVQYLKGLVARATAIQKWVDQAENGTLLRDTLDLSELFRPDTFLNALRQQTARELRCSMDNLKFVSSWRGGLSGAKLPIKLGGLQLEGCSFDGTQLFENQRDSPSVSAIPPCLVAWVPKESADSHLTGETISLPIYYDITRDRIVTRLDVPCGGNINQWLQCGAALFLKNQ